jgi:hypothetical protein
MWLPAGRLIRAVLLVVSLLSGDDGACGAAVLPPHASALKFKPCEKDSAAQRFKIPAAGETGLVVDSDTGRCLAVLDCLLPNKQPQLQAAGMGVVVLDECGAGSCDGANQQWTHVTSTAGHFELVSTLNPTFAMGEGRQLAGVLVESWKLMGTFNPENVDNENVVVQKINPVANTAFSQTNPAETWTGLEIGSALAGGAGGYGPTCPAGDHCVRRPSAPLSCPVVRWLLRAYHVRLSRVQCLEALPCVAPCSLPTSFGLSFIIVFTVCSTVYVGGGIAYNHKVKGERLVAENLRQLLPHVEHWQALGGLVSDGMSFSKTSWDACVFSP